MISEIEISLEDHCGKVVHSFFQKRSDSMLSSRLKKSQYQFAVLARTIAL